VQWIDRFGNLITNIGTILLPDENKSSTLQIQCAGHKITGLAQAYGQQNPGQLMALIGSSGYLEIAVVDGSAANALCATVGAPVIVEW
jgi:S-adenosyl-L-methionine hydrolase (adenosine-forming)